VGHTFLLLFLEHQTKFGQNFSPNFTLSASVWAEVKYSFYAVGVILAELQSKFHPVSDIKG
jgi:hypothetical protein